MGTRKIKKLTPKPVVLLKLDLGAGETKLAGFQSVDLYGAPDFRMDLMKFPWGFKDGCVEEVHCSHFFEHVPGLIRGNFMDELWRILKPCGCEGPCATSPTGSVACTNPGGKATFITPWWASERASQDYTHQWPPISQNSYLYFNRWWREQNKLSHYLCKCDFDFTYGYALDPETAARNGETQAFWARRYINAVTDLHVTLSKRGK